MRLDKFRARRAATGRHGTLIPGGRSSDVMAKHPLIPCILAACVAACGQPAPAPVATATPAETGYIARVQALSPGQREGVLFRAIQGSPGGQGCQGIDQVESRPATKAGQPVWRVTCDGGAQWAVMLADDGTALVTGARD